MKRIITITAICGLTNFVFSQNFGIDQPTPLVKLHVNGNAFFDLPSGGAALENSFTIKKTGQGQINFGSYPGSWTPALQIQNNDNTKYIWLSPLSASGNARLVSMGSDFDIMPGNTLAATFYTNGSMRVKGDIFADNNYGQGLVGVYSATRYQNVFAMGTAYRLSADGTSPGNLYGLAWTHSNIGGQSKAGLGHQLLAMSNGVTTAAMGNGFWTNYNIEFGNYLFGNGKYVIDATDSWLRLNQQGSFGSGTYTPNLFRSDGGYEVDGNTVIDSDAGWHRTYGATGWYNGTYAGGWYMQDATWIRNYNEKQVYINTNAGSVANAMMFDQNNATQDHVVATENNGWGYLGTSGVRWWAIYSSQVLNPSTLKLKTDVKYLSSKQRDDVLDAVNNIESIRYKWNKEVWQKENGYFTDGRYHAPGEKPDPNQEVQEWMGFTAESLPEDCLDNTGENFQIGAMLGLLVASTKSLTKRTEVLGDALNVDFDNLPKDKMDKNISDFGTGVAKGNEMWVSYSADFAAQLGGSIPVVTVTTDNPEVVLSVKDKSSKGFKVVSSSGKTANFDYIAMAKVKYTLPHDSPEQIAKQQTVHKTDINAWRAEEMKNQKMLPQQVGNPAEEALLKQQKSSPDPALKGTSVIPTIAADSNVPPDDQIPIAAPVNERDAAPKKLKGQK